MAKATPETLPVGSPLCTLDRLGRISAETTVGKWTPTGKVRAANGALLSPDSTGALYERGDSAAWYPMTPDLVQRSEQIREILRLSWRISENLDSVQSLLPSSYGLKGVDLQTAQRVHSLVSGVLSLLKD